MEDLLLSVAKKPCLERGNIMRSYKDDAVSLAQAT